MTKYLTLAGIIIMLGLLPLSGNPPKGAVMEFDPESYDYGTVYTDNLPEPQVALEFLNTGNSPLIISQVTGCCGTRITHWPRSPINPGEKGTINIEIRLNPKPHRINRTLTILSNSSESPSIVFRITGEVVDASASETLK